MERIEKVVISNLPSGLSLVAQRSLDPDYPEIFLYLEEKNGVVKQDLAIIGCGYSYDEEGHVAIRKGEYYVKVYADEKSEDYTHSFKIKEYEEEKDV